MARCVLYLCLLFALSAAPSPAETVEDPSLANVGVGDWIEFRIAMPPEVKMESTTRQTVTKVTDTEVTIEVENKTTMNGNPIPPQKLPSMVRPRKIEKVKADELQSAPGKKGEEKIKAADGKEYTCTVYENETQGKKTRTYICKELPLGGLVRTEIDGKAAMEMIGWGRGK